MDHNKYTIFLEVAKYNSISKAADSLGYTQSGVSHTLKRMEEDYNLVLFHRNRSGAFLTQDGKELLPFIRQLVQCEENLKQSVASLHNLHKGTLNIGSYTSISRNWLPSIIHHFKMDYPSIHIHFMEGGNKDILSWLKNREVDLGFLSADVRNTNIEWIPLAKDPLLAVVPKDYPVPSSGVLPLQTFNDKTFIISALGTDIDVHRTLKRHHITPDIQYSAKDDYTIISMVAHHLGVSILPELVLNNHDSSVLTLPLFPDCVRELGIAIPSANLASPITTKFIEYTKNYLQQ